MFICHANNGQNILQSLHAKHNSSSLSIDSKVINDRFLEHLHEIHPGERDFGHECVSASCH